MNHVFPASLTIWPFCVADKNQRFVWDRPHRFMLCRKKSSHQDCDFIEFCRWIAVARVGTQFLRIIWACAFLIAPGCWSPVSPAVLGVVFPTCSCDFLREASYPVYPSVSGLSYPVYYCQVLAIYPMSETQTPISLGQFPMFFKLTGLRCQGPFESRRRNPV